MAQGGILDSARLSVLAANAIGCSARDVQAMVLGTHGDDMVPLRHGVSVRGLDAANWIDEDTWTELVARTRQGGTEILQKFVHNGAFVTPAAAVLEMIEALWSQRSRVLPVSTASNGAYGLPPDIFLGLPVLLGGNGIERVLEVPLLASEAEALERAGAALDNVYKKWRQH